MSKIYGGFRLDSRAWDTLKLFKQKGQDYTKTIEEALALFKTMKELEQLRLNEQKQARLNNENEKNSDIL